MTKIISVNPENFNIKEIDDAAKIIKDGGLCAFPTETVYGLGAGIYYPDAIKNIFKAKGRPQDNPLIVHISSFDEIYPLVKEVPESAIKLAENFWGGPLTIILPRSEKIINEISAGLDTVAIRLPSHPVACALIKAAGCPIAAPSANLSGKPSPTVAKHVIDDLSGKIDCIIDGGSAFYGLESTVCDLTSEVPTVLRPGAVTAEQIRSVLGSVSFSNAADAPKSPGMKYTHYAPNAPMVIVDAENAIDIINEKATENSGVLYYKCDRENFKSQYCLCAGNDIYEFAANYFYNLRRFDEMGVESIFAMSPEKDGMGQALWNRLLKSAGGNIICE